MHHQGAVQPKDKTNSLTICGLGEGITTFSTSSPLRSMTCAPASTAASDRGHIAGQGDKSFATDRHRQMDRDQVDAALP